MVSASLYLQIIAEVITMAEICHEGTTPHHVVLTHMAAELVPTGTLTV